MRLVLFEPDIPQNAGALIRLAAGMGIGVAITEPCGFLFTDKGLHRAGMDYLDMAEVARHASWRRYLDDKKAGRVILLTTKAAAPYTEFAFRPHDAVVRGRESAGVPADVHETADARLRIPLQPGLRSLNVAQAGAMVL